MTCTKMQIDLCSPVGDLCSPVGDGDGDGDGDRNRMLDPTPFIGKPYRVGARGPDAYDCWGLVMACCPWMPDDWADEDMAVRKVIRVIEGQMRDDRWERVAEPCAGAVAIFGAAGRATHTGLLWPVSGGVRVVHALQGVGVITQTLSTMQRIGLNLKGAYLWRG